MARPQIATELEEITQRRPLIEGEEDNQTELEILSELNASAQDITWKFRVSRVLGASKDGLKEPYLFEGDGSIMTGLHERLASEYGTGKYRVRVMRNNVLWKRLDVEVVAPAKPHVSPERQSEMAMVLAAIERQNERMIQILERQNQPQIVAPPVAPANPFEGIQQIATVMVSLKDLMGPKTDPTMSTMDAILKGVELAKSVSENSGGAETNWMDLVKTFISSPIAAEMAKGQQVANEGNKQTNLPSSRLSSLPSQKQTIQPNPQANPAQPQTNNANIQMQEQIRQSILYLCMVAAKNGDPELYAEWVLDNWPREMVVSVLQQTNAIPLLVQFAPEAQPHIPWFKNLIEEVRLTLQDELAGSGNPSNASADISPVQPHGNSGWGGGGESDAEADE